MARDIKKNPLDKRSKHDRVTLYMDELWRASKPAWDLFDERTRAAIEAEIWRFDKLSWEQIGDRLRNRLETVAYEFAAQMGVDPDYEANYKKGLFQDPPPSVLGQTASVAQMLAAEQFGVVNPRAQEMVAEQLVKATQAIRSMEMDRHAEFMKDFRRITSTADMEDPAFSPEADIIDTLMTDYSESYGLNPGLAKTVMQGTYMGTYRGYGLELAKDQGIELWLYTGPGPIEGRNGHSFCQDHFGEEHSEDEWIEIARNDDELVKISRDRGDPITWESVFRWCGGYGCRHHFRPVL